jgi:hypothetical protein
MTSHRSTSRAKGAAKKHRRRFQSDIPIGTRYPAFTCSCGKQAYRTKATAKQNALWISPEERMRVYKCPLADVWHLTSYDAAEAEAYRSRNTGENITRKP